MEEMEIKSSRGGKSNASVEARGKGNFIPINDNAEDKMGDMDQGLQ